MSARTHLSATRRAACNTGSATPAAAPVVVYMGNGQTYTAPSAHSQHIAAVVAKCGTPAPSGAYKPATMAYHAQRAALIAKLQAAASPSTRRKYAAALRELDATRYNMAATPAPKAAPAKPKAERTARMAVTIAAKVQRAPRSMVQRARDAAYQQAKRQLLKWCAANGRTYSVRKLPNGDYMVALAGNGVFGVGQYVDTGMRTLLRKVGA